MGILDILGITKRVNETDINRKKEEIDALYAEMLTITDNLTKTAQKIKDLKDQINKLPPADDKKEADSDNNKVENSNSNNISEPQPETESQPIPDDAEENEDQSLVENAAPVSQQGSENVLANQAPQQTVQPLFGTGRTTTTAPMYNPNGVMNNNNNNNNNMPQPYMQPMQTQQIQQPYGQQMPQSRQSYIPQDNNRFDLQNSDLQSSDGGKKKRKTKSANSLKRKRRTRRNKKAGAAVEAAPAAVSSATEAAAET